MCKHGGSRRRLPTHQHHSFRTAMKQHNVPHDESRRRRYKQHRSSPDHFCFGRDEIGNLTHDCIVERLNVMLWKENTIYNYDHFVTTTPSSAGAAASDAAAIATPSMVTGDTPLHGWPYSSSITSFIAAASLALRIARLRTRHFAASDISVVSISSSDSSIWLVHTRPR